MEDIIIGELEKWKSAKSEEIASSHLTPGTKIHLSYLPTEGLYQEFYEFWMYQIENLRLSSIRHDCWPFHQVARFLTEKYHDLESLLLVSEEILERNLLKWLLCKGNSLFIKKRRTDTGKEEVCRSQARTFLSKVYLFLHNRSYTFSVKEDIWLLDRLPFEVSQNKTHRAKTLSFKRINNEPYKSEVKRAVFSMLQFLDVCTAQSAILAAERLEEFFSVRFPKVLSVKQITRKQIEEFLIFLNVSQQRNAYSLLYVLKTMFLESAKIEECARLEKLIIADDISMHRKHIKFKVFSNDEIKRFNTIISILDEQTARILLIHQLTGNRINETLSLKRNCLIEKNRKFVLRVFQHKTGRMLQKPITDDAALLITNAIFYSEKACEDSEYIFPRDGHPELPMSYSSIRYRIKKALNIMQLKDDNGKDFKVSTHLFRHSYAKCLTELHVSDEVIARLLGHANTSSLKHYRRFADMALAEETKEIRNRMSNVLEELSKGW